MLMIVGTTQYTLQRNQSVCLCFMSSQSVKYRLLHGRLEKIGESSADTAATETYYMKGYYNLEEETIKVKI